MQIKRITFGLTAMLALFIASCRKTNSRVVADVYKGVVLYNICGNIVIQTNGPRLLGEDNWVDENDSSKSTYDHVFTVANPCNFGNYSSGDSINFVLTAPRPQTCVQCLIYIATPSTRHNVAVLK